MPLDFEVGRCTRHCAVSDRRLDPGEAYYSALVPRGAEVERVDFAAAAWNGPPDGAIGWWRSRLDNPNGRRPLAPNEVLLALFERWSDEPEQTVARYVLALLLLRRKVLRIEEGSPLEEEPQSNAAEVLRLYCPHDDTTHEVVIATPTPEEARRVDEQLLGLLHADAA